MFRKLLAVLILALATLAPAHATPPPTAPLVLAAASLQESMNAAADAWARSGHPRPVLSFAASSALARQVAAGAPADLFASADQEWMDWLAQRRLIVPATRATFVGNRLVIVSAASRIVRVPLARGPLARLLSSGPLAMASMARPR